MYLFVSVSVPRVSRCLLSICLCLCPRLVPALQLAMTSYVFPKKRRDTLPPRTNTFHTHTPHTTHYIFEAQMQFTPRTPGYSRVDSVQSDVEASYSTPNSDDLLVSSGMRC
jgi:hypothetical protein